MIRIERSTERTTESCSSNSSSQSNCSVNSFLQYLRHQLRQVASNRKKSRISSIDWKNVDLKSFSSEQDEICALIDLLVLRVRSLSNENNSKSTKIPSLPEIDKTLVEFLYFLFRKFLDDEKSKSEIDRNQFVEICQKLVRHGCFDFSSSASSMISDPSTSESSTEKNSSQTEIDEPTKINDENSLSEPICPISSINVDDQSQLTTDNYRSCESDWSHSSYFSPNSSFDNVQTMVHQTFDELRSDFRTSKTLSSVDDLFKANESTTSISRTEIYSGLNNQSLPNVEMTNEQNSIDSQDRMARKERKFTDRWFSTTKDYSTDRKTNLLDIEFTPIAVLRRKFLDKTEENFPKSNSSTTNFSNSHDRRTKSFIDEKSSTMEKDEISTNENFYSENVDQNETQKNDNEEKKNNSFFTENDCHAPRTLLINDEPAQVRSSMEKEEKEEEGEREEEKKERERTSTLLVEQEQSDRRQLNPEDESNLKVKIDESIMENKIDQDEIYKKIELEEIFDDEDVTSNEKNNNAEPIDFIQTEDENKQQMSKVNRQRSAKENVDPVLSCYEKAFAKVVDGIEETTSPSNDGHLSSNPNQQIDTDPIALRALKRFEEKMNAAAAKNSFSHTNTLPNKGKSSWSGSMSSTRKSLENLFKATEPINFQMAQQEIQSQTETSQQPEIQILTVDNQTENETKAEQLNDSTKVSDNERENNSSIVHSSNDESTTENNLMPYRLQLEGRRRLNTIERIRERRDSLDNNLDQTNLQDPISSRTIQHVDEKNQYEQIEDPIVQRALMRFESNIKRSSNAVQTTNNENRFINSYTIPSLQTTNEPPSNNSNNTKTTYVSVHQRYCVPPSTIERNSEPQQTLISSRQRSRSEDMLSSRDLTMGQTTDLDQNQTENSSQLQRNRSSNQLAVNSNELSFPNALIKTLEPNFVRTTESSISYATPTQTYSSYSCEYTRPRRNLGTSTSNTPSPSTTLKNENVEHEIVRPTAFRPNSNENPLMSAFSNVRTNPTTTSTTNHYNQTQTSHKNFQNPNTASSSEDPIIRRALERFNSKVQNSLMTTSQFSNNFYPRNDQQQNDFSTNRSTTNPQNSLGYQSIIGRRRQTRYDERPTIFKDQTTVGDGYTSSVFVNAQNFHPSNGNHFQNFTDEPPIVPTRFRRDNYRNDELFRRHSTDDFLSENTNNNNNTLNYGQEPFVHHAYPATITTNATSFRPIQIHYNHQTSTQDNDDFRQQTQSPMSTDSSEIFHSTSIKKSPDSSQIISDSNPMNNPSVFNRMAYTGNKAMLSKSSSSLLNPNLKSCEIDFDEPLIDESNPTVDFNDQQTFVSPSKFMTVQNRTTNYSNRPSNKQKTSNGNHFHSEQNTPIEQHMTIPVQRYLSNNVNAVVQSASKSRPPVSIPIQFDRRDSNSSTTEPISRTSKRNEENRNTSTTFRQVPVSIFSPTKPENKIPSNSMSTSQIINQPSTGFVRSATLDLELMSRSSNDEQRRQISANSGSKTPTNFLSNESSSSNDKHDHHKKMNVFERLFRGNKKKH